MRDISKVTFIQNPHPRKLILAKKKTKQKTKKNKQTNEQKKTKHQQTNNM